MLNDHTLRPGRSPVPSLIGVQLAGTPANGLTGSHPLQECMDGRNTDQPGTAEPLSNRGLEV